MRCRASTSGGRSSGCSGSSTTPCAGSWTCTPATLCSQPTSRTRPACRPGRPPPPGTRTRPWPQCSTGSPRTSPARSCGTTPQRFTTWTPPPSCERSPRWTPRGGGLRGSPGIRRARYRACLGLAMDFSWSAEQEAKKGADVLDRHVRYRVDEAVGWVTLDRPEAMNALSEEVFADLFDVVRAANDDPAVRVLIVTGT